MVHRHVSPLQTVCTTVVEVLKNLCPLFCRQPFYRTGRSLQSLPVPRHRKEVLLVSEIVSPILELDLLRMLRDVVPLVLEPSFTILHVVPPLGRLVATLADSPSARSRLRNGGSALAAFHRSSTAAELERLVRRAGHAAAGAAGVRADLARIGLQLLAARGDALRVGQARLRLHRRLGTVLLGEVAAPRLVPAAGELVLGPLGGAARRAALVLRLAVLRGEGRVAASGALCALAHGALHSFVRNGLCSTGLSFGHAISGGGPRPVPPGRGGGGGKDRKGP